jgi:hypothetical protein
MKLTKRTYTHHYKLSVNIPKRPFWLCLAILSIGLTALLGLAVYRWATSSSVYYINPASEEKPTTMRRLDPSEYSEETKKRMAVVDTNGASPELIHYIEKYAKEYGVSARYLVCLAREESRFDPNARGDSGLSVGVFQFKLGTWQEFRQKMGLSTEDLRGCEEESVRTTAWAISNGLDRHWSVANKCAEENI